jgi:NAD+ synthase
MELIDAITAWIKEQVTLAGAEGVVVGLSGGIDSSVVAALAKQSLGNRVVGLILPCRSPQEDRDDAQLIVSHLQLETYTFELSPVYDAFITVLPPGDIKIKANIKPRLRMIILYYFAGIRNYLVAGTGNKSEISVGYFTKYGDGGADILPLGDLLKSEVRSIARALALPEKIINKPPTAGLWPGQTDEGELQLTYEQLDQAIEEITSHQLKETPPEIYARIEKLMNKSLHKRLPIPVCKVH